MDDHNILHELLLPIGEEGLEGLHAEMLSILKKKYGVSEENAYQYVMNEKEKWAEDPESIPDAIYEMFDLVYRTFHKEIYEVFPYNLESIAKKIFRSRSLAFEEIFVFLSYIPLLYFFAKKHRMSAAKIASLMSVLDSRLEKFSWRQYQTCFKHLGISQALAASDVATICDQDKKQEFPLLGDASVEVASEMVGSKAVSLGVKGGDSLTNWLKTLVGDKDVFFPYIQILHYQCLISEWYDHHLTTLYEFSPRGEACSRLLKEYEGYTSTGNPFLNNAKAVDTIDGRWVLSRDQNIDQANALVEILEVINEMNYASARELCRLVRAWIYRVLSIKHPGKVMLTHFSLDQISKFSISVSSKESQSKGIIEQRLFDYWCTVMHPESKGWREKGIGDSVNANNLSRKKFGDLDFQDTFKKQIVSYEIHAGTLNLPYFEGHRRTLKRIIALRSEDLSAIADISEWRLEVRYIAHSINFDAPDDEFISGLKVSYSFQIMKDFLALCPEPSVMEFNRLFVDALNKPNSPQIVRQKVLIILND